MKKDHHEEALIGTDALRTFAQQFDPESVYGRIILEELLKTILGIKENEEEHE